LVWVWSEAALDGIYVIRTNVGAERLDAAATVEAYKELANVERDFSSLKAIDLDLRPIYHHLEDRVRAHVLICMLAGYLVWHLRRAWAPLCFTDEQAPPRLDPVGPATVSPAAKTKASTHQTVDGDAAHNFASLLHHLATLTRNTIVFAGGHHIDKLATPTPTQRRAFELLGATMPISLTP
jgi:hypothetical protein